MDYFDFFDIFPACRLLSQPHTRYAGGALNPTTEAIVLVLCLLMLLREILAK
jgi:hypothetical protein